LYKRANGFYYETEKVFHTGRCMKVTEYALPDVGAQRLWLQNRMPEVYREQSVAGTGGPAADIPSADTAPRHEITLGEEEISDVSLATFYVFDKENLGTSRPSVQLAYHRGCRGCRGCGRGCGGWRGCGGCGGCGGSGGCGPWGWRY